MSQSDVQECAECHRILNTDPIAIFRSWIFKVNFSWKGKKTFDNIQGETTILTSISIWHWQRNFYNLISLTWLTISIQDLLLYWYMQHIFMRWLFWYFFLSLDIHILGFYQIRTYSATAVSTFNPLRILCVVKRNADLFHLVLGKAQTELTFCQKRNDHKCGYSIHFYNRYHGDKPKINNSENTVFSFLTPQRS